MIGALFRALGQLFDPRIVTLVGACALLSVACFVGAWFGIDWLLVTAMPESGWAQTLAAWFGGLATVVAAWFLFPTLTIAFVGLFLESVARAVEAKHYPDLPKPPGLPFFSGVGASLRFLAVVLVANAFLLATLLVPPVSAIAYFVVNGWLLGREYFELVALRRVAPATARDLRRAHGSELLGTGILFTCLLPLPPLNLVIPILATATMVHRFEQWRRALPPQPAGG